MSIVHLYVYYTLLSITDATVTPTNVTRLNTPPYDMFSFNCVIGITPPTNMYSVYWPQEDMYGVGNVMNNGLESNLTVDITDGLSANTYMYTCTVTVNGTDGTAMTTDNATVIVKGIAISYIPNILT